MDINRISLTLYVLFLQLLFNRGVVVGSVYKSGRNYLALVKRFVTILQRDSVVLG